MTACAFCGRDPYEYVNNGIGMEAVAVTCCDLGIEVYDHRVDPDSECSITVSELREIAGKLAYMSEKLAAYEDKHGDIWSEGPEPAEVD